MEHPSLRRTETTIVMLLEVKRRRVNKTDNVLMWIHVDLEAILLAFAQHFDGIIHEIVVISSTVVGSVSK